MANLVDLLILAKNRPKDYIKGRLCAHYVQMWVSEHKRVGFTVHSKTSLCLKKCNCFESASYWVGKKNQQKTLFLLTEMNWNGRDRSWDVKNSVETRTCSGKKPNSLSWIYSAWLFLCCHTGFYDECHLITSIVLNTMIGILPETSHSQLERPGSLPLLTVMLWLPSNQSVHIADPAERHIFCIPQTPTTYDWDIPGNDHTSRRDRFEEMACLDSGPDTTPCNLANHCIPGSGNTQGGPGAQREGCGLRGGTANPMWCTL